MDDGRRFSYNSCPYAVSDFSQEAFIVRSYYSSQGHSPIYQTDEKPNWVDEGEGLCGGVEREAREEEMRRFKNRV